MPLSRSKLIPTDIEQNRRLFILGVVSGGVAGTIALPSVILPWVWIVLGAPVALIGLTIPLLQAGRVLGPLLALRPLSGMRRHKWLVVGAEALWGLLFLMLAGVALLSLHPTVSVLVMLSIAFLIGIARGTARFGYREVIARTLPEEGRGGTMSTAVAVSGLLAFALALLLSGLGLTGTEVGTEMPHIILGALFALGSAFGFGFLFEKPVEVRSAGSIREVFRKGMDMFRSDQAARRYMVFRLLLLSLDLALPFYSAHAAVTHGTTGTSLGLIIVFSSLANILQKPLWGKLLDRSAGRSAVLSSYVAASAGLLLVGIELFGGNHHILIHGLAFLLICIALGGGLNGRNMLLVQIANEETRPILSAASASFSGIVGLGLAAVLGLIAHLQNIIPAIGVLVVLQIGTGIYGAWMMKGLRSGTKPA